MKATDYGWERHSPKTTSDPHQPTLVLLSGLFAGGWIWDATWDALTKDYDYDVVRFPDSLLRLDMTVDSVLVWRSWLFEFLNEAQIERPILCGNSVGGLIVLDFAAAFPELVQAVITSGAPGMTRKGLLSLGGPDNTLALPTSSSFVKKLFHDPNRLNPEFLNRVIEEVNHPTRFRAFLRALQVAQEYDAAPILANISCPVLFIWGEHDRVSPISDWLPHLSKLKDGQLVQIPDCGHSPMVEKPEEFNTAFLGFLQVKAAT